MHPLLLHAHPVAPRAALSRIEVRVGFTAGRVLELDYELQGDLTALRIPPPAAPLRTDGLWRHTCCEIFVRVPGEIRYYEWNFAPSGAWAFYAFDGYRAAAPELAVTTAPRIHWQSTATHANLRAEVALADLPLQSATALQAALSAVIETVTEPGSSASPISYWALTHPPGEPDFHHPENFVLTLS